MSGRLKQMSGLLKRSKHGAFSKAPELLNEVLGSPVWGSILNGLQRFSKRPSDNHRGFREKTSLAVTQNIQ